MRYDAAKRLTQENVGGDIRSYSYDARGHLISAVNSNGQVELSYDAAGRLVSEIQNGLAVSSNYDQDNNRIGLSYADESLSISRNGLGLAQSITSSLNGESYNFTYDANGILLATLLPNGLANSMSYNQGYDLSAITAGLSSLVYSHDDTGLITNKTIDGASTSYSYDDGRRLISAGAANFSYDVAGNILKGNAAFDIANNRISEDSNTRYSYDAAGNLREKQNKLDNSKKLYGWNSRNELISVESFDGENNSLYRMAFSYGPLGRRLTKTVDTITDTYLYDGPDIVAILDTDQGVISTLVHGDSIDTPLSISTYDSTCYYHRDHQGSILSLTSSNQSEVESLSYDAYGQTIFSQSEATNNPYGYTGREFDDADLYYYRARYYDPSIGRFLSEDPIGFYSGDFNFYRYVQNDPVNSIDPLGLFNPSKGLSSAGNAINAGRLYATGTLKLLAAGGMTGTGVAAPAGVGTAALGTWNLSSGGKAWERSVQQWNEALRQNWSDATWRNLLGMLPYGSEFDDPCEPSALEFLKEKAKDFKNKPGEVLRELGTMGF